MSIIEIIDYSEHGKFLERVVNSLWGMNNGNPSQTIGILERLFFSCNILYKKIIDYFFDFFNRPFFFRFFFKFNNRLRTSLLVSRRGSEENASGYGALEPALLTRANKP